VANRFFFAVHFFEAVMKRITSAELVRFFSRHSDDALTEPLLITRHGRQRLVMLNVDAFRELLNAASTTDERVRRLQAQMAPTGITPRGESISDAA
jgi:PHD/YefM family antitoxin component YafN of YafNO toxin-antitoxin module